MSELSSLGSKIERLGNILRNTASDQIKDYQQRFSSMAGLYEQAFKELIIDKYDTTELYNNKQNTVHSRRYVMDILYYIAWQRRVTQTLVHSHLYTKTLRIVGFQRK